jgi:hypothetical protein
MSNSDPYLDRDAIHAALEADARQWRRDRRERIATAARATAWAAAATEAEAAGSDERTAQADELRRVCREIEDGRDPYPEEDER